MICFYFHSFFIHLTFLYSLNMFTFIEQLVDNNSFLFYEWVSLCCIIVYNIKTRLENVFWEKLEKKKI